QKEQSREAQAALLNVLEVFLRDLLVYRSTQNKRLITNIDQLEVIQKFCQTLADARLEEMIDEVNRCKPMIHQNVKGKLVFTALVLRFSSLMRDRDHVITHERLHQHLPALSQS